MARYVTQETPVEQIERLLPNLILLVILLLALLVVLTKFSWIHCSQVPGFDWCSTYCTYIEQGKSRVAVLYGDDGIGDPLLLEYKLRNLRGFTLTEPLHGAELSAGILKKYDLIVIEHFRTASSRQVDAVKGYLDSGGTVIWVGDSFSNQYVDDFDLLSAQQKNESFYNSLIDQNVTPNSTRWNNAWNQVKQTQWYKYVYNRTDFKGFDEFANYLRARYKTTVPITGAKLRIVDPNHLLVRGLFKEYDLPATQLVQVAPDASGTELLAQVITTNGTYPGIMETRYAGRIIYVSFPLEDVGSQTLLTNALDYLAPC